MMANMNGLEVALCSLRILDEALSALRQQLSAANPELLAATAPSYVQRIAPLQSEIADYLLEHPVAEVFGLPADNLTDDADRHRQNHPCPFGKAVNRPSSRA